MFRRPFFVGLTAVLAVTLIGIAIQAAFDARKQSAPPHATRRDGASAALPLAATGGADITAALTTWIEGVASEQARIAADEMARVEAARRSGGPGAPATRAAPAGCEGIDWPDLRGRLATSALTTELASTR